MRCAEAGHFVSAMQDGEAVPLEAAEHIAHCAECRAVLQEYAELGGMLRGYGSLLKAEPALDRTWTATRRSKTEWWKKGLQMMRIPRIAFASLLLLLAALGSRLALVEVRAHGDWPVLMLKLTPAEGESTQCFLSTVDTQHDHCDGLWQVDNSNLLYSVRALRKEGNRVLLSLRSRVTPMGPGRYGPETEKTLPETQSWFTPGESLPMPGTGELKLALTGEWTDHVPVGGSQALDPGPNEIRLTDPLILKGNAVVGDTGANADGESISFYVPGEGRFLFFSGAIAGAVPATVTFNRISFESNGQHYVVINGMPVSRGEKLWVIHDAAYKPSEGTDQELSLGAGPANRMR